VLAVPLASGAPQQGNKPRVVIFTPLPYGILDESIAGIKEGLTASGYGSDKVDLTEINANGQFQLLSAYAREIISSHPTIIVPVSTPATEAVVSIVPETQDVIFSTVTDPAKAKIPASPSHITGVSDVVDYQANINLLQELFPKVRRVGIIYNPGDDAAVFGLDKSKPIFKAKGLVLSVVPASNSNEVINAARSLIGSVDAIYIGSDNIVAAAMPGLVAVTRTAGVPVIASDAGSVRNGALAAVSVDYRKLGNSVARLIADVLRSGAPAGQFPRIGFVGNALVLNTETARQIGYHFPASVLARNPQVVGAETRQ
jgi:putative ABC transport system substrate-binding protein